MPRTESPTRPFPLPADDRQDARVANGKLAEPLSPEEVMDILSYCPETGSLHWKVSRGTRRAGSSAGTLQSRGYLQVKIGRRGYLAHRLAWAIHYGAWPEDQVDHRNCIKTDNRIDNLRQATNSLNQANRPADERNRSGFKGVAREFVNARLLGWVASITVNGVRFDLGSFPTKAEARAAYDAAAKQHFGDFARSS